MAALQLHSGMTWKDSDEDKPSQWVSVGSASSHPPCMEREVAWGNNSYGFIGRVNDLVGWTGARKAGARRSRKSMWVS